MFTERFPLENGIQPFLEWTAIFLFLTEGKMRNGFKYPKGGNRRELNDPKTADASETLRDLETTV